MNYRESVPFQGTQDGPCRGAQGQGGMELQTQSVGAWMLKWEENCRGQGGHADRDKLVQN